MQNWQNYLNGDPIPWLLEPANPSVRYWTLVDILDRPADDSEVQETRAAVLEQPLVKELFGLQHPKGFWGEDETKPHTAQGAVTVLSLLHTLGVPPDLRTAAGCDSLLKNSQNACGGFSMTRTLRSGIFPCTTGEHLPFLVYFGFGNDPRVQAAFTFLIEDMSKDSALNCGRYQHQDCLWGAIAGLKGLSVLPTDMQSSQSKEVTTRLASALLNAAYDFNGEHKRWLTFGVPRVWDLISALKVVVYIGYTQNDNFEPLLQRIMLKQDSQGRWLCGSVSRTWPLEKRGQPSKWVTLDALRMLKRIPQN